MRRPRVIPVLLLKNGGLVKTVRFRNPSYVGDPMNAVKIFNEKECDELIVLDITATPQARPPDLAYLSQLATECFMPLCYGGGVATLKTVESLMALGIEKIAINSAACERPDFVAEAAREFGSSTIVVSIDVGRDFWGRRRTYSHAGRKPHAGVEDASRRAAENGAGELLVTSIERDGTYLGYDLDLIAEVAAAVPVPVIACGGAGGLDDFRRAFERGASAVAAGSLFVYYGPNRAVLINYPHEREITALAPTS
jgi:cyclase